MIRFAATLLIISCLGACGIDGAPIPPEGAVEPVAEEGTGLTGEMVAI